MSNKVSKQWLLDKLNAKLVEMKAEQEKAEEADAVFEQEFDAWRKEVMKIVLKNKDVHKDVAVSAPYYGGRDATVTFSIPQDLLPDRPEREHHRAWGRANIEDLEGKIQMVEGIVGDTVLVSGPVKQVEQYLR